MKEYTDMSASQSGKVQEPVSAYASSKPKNVQATGISHALMDELLHQSDEVKLMIIHRLKESMMADQPAKPSKEEQMAARRKEIEAKLDELHVTGSLRNLVGAIPLMEGEDYDWKKEKEAYLREKYGL